MNGPRLFARYAFAPNKLGYCGPADAVAAFGGAPVREERLRELARGFHGAWPYLVVLADLAGVADPLDQAVVESYWLGGGLGDQVDRAAFGKALLAWIGPRAGHYWQHLTDELVDEAAPNHCFHVFGVYPWSRLLTTGPVEPPLHVLDNCRIRTGEVVAVDGDQVTVRTAPLTFEAGALVLGKPEPMTFTSRIDAPRPGEQVALHWEWVVDRLTDDQAASVTATTAVQLDVTNRRPHRSA